MSRPDDKDHIIIALVDKAGGAATIHIEDIQAAAAKQIIQTMMPGGLRYELTTQDRDTPAPRKSVSCCNPWCSDRALCTHCKALPGNATATDSERMQSSMRQIMAAETAGRVVQSDPSGSMSLLGNLLAVIHGDGGHRQVEIGSEQAAREAEEIVTQMRVKAEAITAAARADAFDDAAALVARQYKIGGLNLTTMESCMKASWMFSNEAYRIREAAGLPNPGATEYMPEAEERLRRTILGDAAVTPEGHVKMPTSEAEALIMVAVGEAFLKGRAEERARMENRS